MWACHFCQARSRKQRGWLRSLHQRLQQKGREAPFLLKTLMKRSESNRCDELFSILKNRKNEKKQPIKGSDALSTLDFHVGQLALTSFAK
jgi:SOS response regulatory protein OraA/RecX